MADLKEKRKSIEANRAESEADQRIKQALEIMENSSSEITVWNELTIRQHVEWVKILCPEEILVCLHGGVEIMKRMEQ